MGCPWAVAGLHITDAEFAAAFRPASDLDELVAAARAIDAFPMPVQRGAHNVARQHLRAALARWDGDQ